METQIDRLKLDLVNIEKFAKELKSEGQIELSERVWMKRNYLQKYIEGIAA